jgi:hypothetical protein
MQYAWFTFVGFLCVVEFFQSGGITHMALLLGVLLLKAQADVAAEKWVKMKALLVEIPRPWVAKPTHQQVEPEEQLPPFQAPRYPEPISLDEARRRRQEQQQAEAAAQAEAKAAKSAPKPATSHSPTPRREPNFFGAPHEVLVIDPQSPTGQIVGAFRHWMKVYHPDHSPQAQELANERARKIQEAKEAMLEKRRKLRKSA